MIGDCEICPYIGLGVELIYYMTGGESEESGCFRAQTVVAESDRLKTGIECSPNFRRSEVTFRTY